MSVKQILLAARTLTVANHTTVPPAVNQAGQQVRAVDPSAVRWTSTGAIGKVAAGFSLTNPRPWFDLTPDGELAADLLEIAAAAMGHTNPIFADDAGVDAVRRMFARALLLAPDDPPSYRSTERTA